MLRTPEKQVLHLQALIGAAPANHPDMEIARAYQDTLRVKWAF